MKTTADHGGAIRRAWVTVLLPLFLYAFVCASASGAASTVIVYPLTGSGIDSRYDYDWAVLRTALEKTAPHYGPFELRQSPTTMSAQRVTQELSNQPGRINIFVRATDPDLEQQFLPIRLPVDRGLLGYRIFLVRAADLPRFAAVRSIDDLRRLRAGLGKGWADVPILQAAQIGVVEGNTYDGLFSMLEAKRFDFFVRAADEATREYDERHAANPHMVVEPTLLLHYQLPRYFFVRRDAEGKLLAERITAGMEMMLRDGSLNELFYRYKGDIIERANLKQRRMLTIPNPGLSPETPLSRSELWYDPLHDK